MSTLRIIEYQPAWPSQYMQVEAELHSALLAPGCSLEHIGSTAVPGLCAKPVIDVALGVVALKDAEENVAALAKLAFTYRPEYETVIPDRRYFVRAEGRTPRIHLHAVILGGTLWLEHLRFRDALRDDRQLRLSYAALKQQLAVLHASDKSAYTEAKAPFIQQVLATCGQTAGRPSQSAA